jgi:predicted dehydrogenase
MKYAIVGCGLVGGKRLAALPAGSEMVVACDRCLSRAQEFVEISGSGRATVDYTDAVSDNSVDAVIVAATNAELFEVSRAAVFSGKHVLVEKPAVISVQQADSLLSASQQCNVRVRVGFNHRFHPALIRAKEIADTPNFGEVLMVRGRYGHGGRVGYEKEWRANPLISGGGELLDQGVHLIDLAGWFLGEFVTVNGHIATSFWDIAVEDNAFLSLQTATGKTAWLHASWTEWKNLFSLEVYGRFAKLHAEGLGGSYGIERLYHYQMRPELGPPDTYIREYIAPDNSWKAELMEFERDINEGRTPLPGLAEARSAIKVVETVYQSSQRNPR